MKALERIFLYSVLVVLVFYVFLVDGNVESQVVIQEEIKARRIVIVNDAGQEVVELSTDVENNGGVVILNKSGNNVVIMGAYEYGGIMSVYNKDGKTHAVMGATENGGAMTVINKDDNAVAGMIVGENDNGEIGVWNKSGKRIGSLP